MELQFTSYPYKDTEWHVLLHNKNDLPDALTIHPGFHIMNQETEYYLRNKHFSKPNTRSKPCSQYHPMACEDVYLHKIIASKYKCQVPVFFTGYHLKPFRGSLPHCNKSVIATMLSLKNGSNCPQSVPCEHTDFSIDGAHLLESTDDCSYLRFKLTYKQVVQENYKSYIKVEEQKLIGEVGGILGLTVGWSGITVVTSLFDIVYSIINMLKNNDNFLFV